ncbi:hypothetical protein FCL47_00970 [Desulfopila sp. IMCC35006]|uniref:cytochrome b N-terminal domain-containing protein n=1 Tax=Desulfopila sp. IMCC35006 TaxID=2569542 RepID=UPI0010ACC199|nr:cytochrome b N-terminal domain-containing protein [Desulfopila sp. IMCC35006]TKB28094.1 hypothetical protein FCL47_00970 [Desulfopila sp. IMCC35006]
MLLLPDPLQRPFSLISRHFSAVKDIKWGAWALTAFYLSLLSGIVVGLQYDYLHPSYATAALDLLAPYGRFFRSLHFFTSQFFFLFSCIHLLAVYQKTMKYSIAEWLLLLGTLPLILLLLFTGYILRGDNTGSSAGLIAEHIILAIPVVGHALNNLLFDISADGLRKVYIHHVIGLDLLLLIFAWNHLRIYRIKIRDHLPIIGLMLIFSVFVSAPFEPDRLGISYISGPWFFLGLQELLRYMPPLAAGVVIPGIFLLALFSAYPTNKYLRSILIVLGASLIFYTVLSAIAWMR